MNAAERRVRAHVYRSILETSSGPTIEQLAADLALGESEVREILGSLFDQHLMMSDNERVVMAHPFSGVPTKYRSQVGDRWWYANCAWDALAILALLGDGDAIMTGETDDVVWSVSEGIVSPSGLIHLQVPARSFWEDVEFT